MFLCRELIAFSTDVQDHLAVCLEKHTDTSCEARQNILKRLSQIKADTRTIKGIAVVFVLLMLYALTKLIAVYVCEEAVWNVNGCVDLSAVTK